MKLTYKGVYQDESQLPKAQLPQGAIPFDEPDDPAELSQAASKFAIFPLGFGAGVYLLRRMLLPGATLLDLIHPLGILFALLAVLPHELLHALAFPRDAEVELFVSPRNLMAFVTSTAPLSRSRFIWMSLLPNLVFGAVPMVLWIFLPNTLWGNAVGAMGFYSAMMGVGDYLNVYNAATQMPGDARTVLSGFHSYWYRPTK